MRERGLYAGLDRFVRSRIAGRAWSGLDFAGRLGLYRRPADRMAGRNVDESVAGRGLHEIRESHRRSPGKLDSVSSLTADLREKFSHRVWKLHCEISGFHRFSQGLILC